MTSLDRTEQEQGRQRRSIQLADAALARAHAARLARIGMLVRLRNALLIICLGGLVVAAVMLITGHTGPRFRRLTSLVSGSGFASFIVGWVADRMRDRLQATWKAMGIVDGNPFAPRQSAHRIPATLGVLVIDPDARQLALEDERALAPLFTQTWRSWETQMQSAEVLLVYAKLDASGHVITPEPVNIRQVAAALKASVVVLAPPNPAASIQQAAALGGPKSANIVFTLDRRDPAFGRFFHGLFEQMRDGTEMLSAWVRQAPQGPGGVGVDAPATVLVAEAGKLAFGRGPSLSAAKTSP